MLLLLFYYIPEKTFAYFALTENCRQAYTAILHYDFDAANQLISREKQINPENKIPLYLENYIDFLYLLTTEDEEKYKRFRRDRDNRLKAISTDRQKSPLKNFTQAEIYLQSSIIRLKFGDYFSAATDIQRAYRLLTENEKNYPDFILNKKSLLPLQAIMGTVPESYQWLLSLFRLDGDLHGSVTEYNKLLVQLKTHPEYAIFSKEVYITLSYLYLHLLNNANEAWQTISKGADDAETNPLTAFVKANIALRVKKNNIAIDVLTPHTRNTPVIAHLDYMMGIALLQKLDDNARRYFVRYLNNYTGESYKKDTWLKLAWTFLLRDDIEKYNNCILLARNTGSTIREEDKQAFEEAVKPGTPHLNILKARLLFDGGYYTEAHLQLQKVNINMLNNEKKAEYYYRLARIYHEELKYAEALKNYNLLISEFVHNNTSYFLPAANYYAGIIYEDRNEGARAIEHYERCISYRDYPYKNSFDHRANAGIKRLRN